MAFDRLNYGKDWTDPEAFPTFEDSEAQVRADLQYHPDAIRTYLNETLLPALEGAGGAEHLGTPDGTVQQILDQCVADIQTLAGGGVPSVSQCVRVAFDEEDWTEHPAVGEENAYYTMSIGSAQHQRRGAAFGYNLWHAVDGQYRSNTWAVLGTGVSPAPDEAGNINLRSACAYTGAIVFFGV